MALLKNIAVALLIHFIGGIIIGFSSMGIFFGFWAGVMYSVLGCFFLIIEVPIVLIGLSCLNAAKTLKSKSVVAIIGLGLSLIYGLRLFLSAGARHADADVIGIAIAILVGALIVILAHAVMWQNQKLTEQDVALDS